MARITQTKYLPTDISTFSTMQTAGYVYVDKTEYIYNLVKEGSSRYYFLSRPRRFGKTLLISTLSDLFLGKKELFEDLWIAKSNYNWTEYPIIHLDFSVIGHRNVAQLEKSLLFHLNRIAQSYGILLQKTLVEDAFYTLVVELAKRNPVVILVDDYDKPMLDHLSNMPEAVAQRDFLKSFFDIIKGMDPYLRSIFITGVSKFSKTSIFSGINNLNDISIKPESAQLLGYTQEEIIHYFPDHIESFIKNKGTNQSAYLEQLRIWYNGYRFSEEATKVYNPFSVLYCLKDQKFSNYWFESGTPSFLINLLKKQFNSLQDVSHLEISSSSLGTFDLNHVPLLPLLFQAGYLTFSRYNSQSQKFTVDFPNYEVEESFKKYLVAVLSYNTSIEVDSALSKLIRA